jgi:hypothetical protein
MNPITFSCEETLPLAPEEIARQILDLTKWPDFHGFGPLPGIKAAAFDVQTPGIVGSRIRVTNQDGSIFPHRFLGGPPSSRKRGSSSAPPTEPTLPVPSGSTPNPL